MGQAACTHRTYAFNEGGQAARACKGCVSWRANLQQKRDPEKKSKTHKPKGLAPENDTHGSCKREQIIDQEKTRTPTLGR